MIYLILSVLISASLVILMLVFRGCKLGFWMNFLNSKFIEKSDLFFENMFSLLKKGFKKLLMILLLEGAEFLFKIKNKLSLFLNRINKKTNRQVNKLYKQKISEPSSDYLKNIEKHRNENLESRDELRF